MSTPGQIRRAPSTALVNTRLKWMQYRPGLLTGFLAGTRLESGLVKVVSQAVDLLACQRKELLSDVDSGPSHRGTDRHVTLSWTGVEC
jgi:hypothetical protein